ncbi:hypothetical protein I3842_07G203200 [Carya illinoinensis]|uniref:GRF-type domain-containing protein n=1 Tax=Carya illinoinensis TaxID=32201 RepID=A0A922JHP9_CARIL|nr:hypothetical protein I3842_07G203200 [Carya illinoinensis]
MDIVSWHNVKILVGKGWRLEQGVVVVESVLHLKVVGEKIMHGSLRYRSPMASSASSCIDNDFLESPICWCGLKAPLKTSQTNKNLERKFYACPKYKYNTREAKRQFFIWADILQLVEERTRTRENAVQKREDDVLLCEYKRVCVLDKLEEEMQNLVIWNKRARISLCLYWVISIVIIFGWLGP